MRYPIVMRVAAAALSLLLLGSVASAQPAPQYSQTHTYNSFTKVGRSTDISATTSSSRQTLTAAPVAIVYNTGSVAAFVELGSNTVTANATTSTFVPPGSCVFMNAVGATNIAGVTASGTATLEVVTGTGTFGSCGGGGGGSSGGGGAVYGLTVVGSPAANPPVLIGGTVDGTAAGNVSVLKVLGGLGFINCANCSGSGVSAADTAAFIAGTSLLAPGGGFFQTTATSNALTNGQTGMWQMTAQRAGFVNLRNASGVELGTAGAPVRVDPTGTTTQPVSIAASVAVTGTFFQATQPISATSLPLPTLAATSTLQTSGAQKTQIVDGSGNVIASTSNNLNVQCANCSGSGVSTADAATFTAGSSLFAGGGGFFQTTATSNPLASGQQGVFQVTANRALFTNLRSATGTELGVAAAPLQVSLANTAANGTAILVTGTGGTFPVSSAIAPVSTMNSASANGGLNAAMAGVFDDVSPVSITENSFGFARMSANRNLYGTLRDAAGNERGANVNASNQLTTLEANSAAILTAINTLNTTAGNPLATQAIANIIGGVGLNATPTLANGNGVVPTQSGAVLSATNGTFANILQGNVALSATNGLFSNTLQGNAALSLTNPGFTRVTDGTTGITVKAASTPSVAGDTAIVVDQRPGSVVSASPGTLALGGTFVSGTTAAMTGTTSTQVIALVSSKILYVTRMSCKGDPANAVGTKVQIRDGSAGTVLDTMTVGASGGGEQGTGTTPLYWTTSGNAVYAQNVTTGASVICTGSGYSG